MVSIPETVIQLLLKAMPVIDPSIFLLLPLGSTQTMELSRAFLNRVSNCVK